MLIGVTNVGEAGATLQRQNEAIDGALVSAVVTVSALEVKQQQTQQALQAEVTQRLAAEAACQQLAREQKAAEAKLQRHEQQLALAAQQLVAERKAAEAKLQQLKQQHEQQENQLKQQQEQLQQQLRQHQEEKECRICLDRARRIAFQPCGHFVCCVECSSPLSACPSCRAVIADKIRTYA